MIYGYYLIMVMMLPTGDVHGEAVDWYFTPYECYEQALYQHENKSQLGVGFVCIEDVIPAKEKNDG